MNKLIKLTRYKKRYAYDKSLEFVIPLLVLLFLGVMYVMVMRIEHGYAGFIILAAASLLMIYWVRELKKMARTEEPRMMRKEQEQKTWVYDLIKGDQELVFVAEVPGPEDQVTVRLINGVLYIRGGQGFAREVQLDVTEDMGIAEFRYRNGVLTLKIRRI
jgi:HSP20 family molecular chaperone IbpA